MEALRVELQMAAVHKVRQNQMEEGDLEIQVEDAYREEGADHQVLLGKKLTTKNALHY